MPILTLQRRLREAGRVRIGQQVATANGKKRPAKLDRFRLTSSDRTAIEAAAALYGGEPHPWNDGPLPGQWEVFTESTVIPVVVPPAAAAFSQWNETWSGGGCTRRCDGERMISLDGKPVDEPCMCASEDAASCKPTTRLNVILGQLPGLGVWRLESHGYYAATELAGTVEVVMGAATRGQLLPASLRLEHREVRRPGEPTRKFVVPILDIAVTPNALGLVVGTQAPALPAGDSRQPAAEQWKPIPQPAPAAELGPGDVAERIQHAQREPAKKRSNSAPPIPRTGAKPRAGRPAPPLADDEPSPMQRIRPRTPDADTTIEPTDPTLSEAQMRKLRALYNAVGINSAAQQKQVTAVLLGSGPIRTHATLTVDQASQLIDTLTRLEAGEINFTLDDNGNVIGAETRPTIRTEQLDLEVTNDG